MAPSSSGPGYLVLIQKIAGSNPAGVTMKVPGDNVFPHAYGKSLRPDRKVGHITVLGDDPKKVRELAIRAREQIDA
jgi:phosphoribosylaminoimidazole carboxylase (NCAIR synthetase)